MILKMEKMLIHIPHNLKKKLDNLRSQGYTVSGFIRALLERELGTTTTKKGG